jgi:hypothetical protein
MKIVPIFQAEAKEFISRYHRHNVPSLTSVFNIGLENEGKLIGVAMVGLPKARLLMDGLKLEVTRTCVLEGEKNANSMLYGACARVAAALGWRQLITYTLPSESGISLKAAGWICDGGHFGGNVDGWESANGNHIGSIDLFGHIRIPDGPKVRWRKALEGKKNERRALEGK